MARGFFSFPFGIGSQRSLSARGQRLNTFAGIGFSVAFSLLALGSYLIEQQFANPLQAQSLDVPFAALLIATALTLLFCLLHPSRKRRSEFTELSAALNWEEKKAPVARSAPRASGSPNTSAPGRYVDPARVCLRR
jgi:hypothetical protein